ncbi:MAG: chemotaxis protein CheW [Armatimonadota bacterium]
MSEKVNEITMDEHEQLVVFQLANEQYGVNIGAVNTIIRMQEVTEVPRTPDYVEGVINLRGTVIPVIDIRKRFGLEVGEVTKATRIVVVEVGDQLIGMIVDAVLETLRLSLDAIEPPSNVVVSVDSQYVRGVGKQDDRLIILLELGNVVNTEQLVAA